MPNWAIAGVLAFVVATITTPAGVSGAVFLLPVQVSLLHVPNPSLTPTNLLFNVIATPGALVRFARRGALYSPLTRMILLGSLPGVTIGAVLRVELLSGRRALLLVVAAVLAPLGLALLRPRRTERPRSARNADTPSRWITPLAAVVGVIGGVYGIGGGSLLSPLLVTAGFTLAAVAPAALTSTFVTSVVGIVTFQLLALVHTGESIAPDWAVGAALGLGGTAGSYLGATLQPRISEQALRRVLGIASIAIAARYAFEALS